jgi:iron complex transport system ATP-binding protein
VTALALRGVKASLGGRAVLQGVDLSLGEGEVLVLAGRNGAGKSTLLRVASGLLRADSGRVEIRGRPIERLARRELARAVAVVSQETSIPFPFRLGEVVLMGRSPHLGLLGFETAADRRLAMSALERLGIADLWDRSIQEVSGGERQLAMVARALVQDAPILLLDEPTAHLDVRRRLQLLELTRELAREGRSVLVVSHDLSLAARAGDRLAVLADGRVVAQGSLEETLRPDVIRAAFGVEAELVATADGARVVVPLRPSS